MPWSVPGQCILDEASERGIAQGRLVSATESLDYMYRLQDLLRYFLHRSHFSSSLFLNTLFGIGPDIYIKQ